MGRAIVLLQTSYGLLRRIRFLVFAMMLCVLPRRLAAFSGRVRTATLQRPCLVDKITRLYVGDFSTDGEGRRIRNRSRNVEKEESNNDWMDVESWDIPKTGSGGGWDDFDPLSAPPQRQSRAPARSQNERQSRDRDFRPSENQYSRRGPSRRGPPSEADASQKKINLKALEGAGYDHVYGLAPVRNALRSQKRELVPLESRFIMDYDETEAAQADERKPEAQFRPYLFLQERKGKGGRSGDKSMQAEEVQRLAEECGLPLAYVDKGALNTLSGNRPHQGCVLRCGKLEFEPLSRIPSGPDSSRLWLVLDQIVDPQNLGALLRSAYFFGQISVLVCAKNSAPPSPTVSASSAGALEDMTVYSTSNLPRTLAAAEQEGFRIIGASASSLPDSDIPVYDLDKLPEDDTRRPTLLVLGSEGHGIRSLVATSCTEFVKIPGADRENLSVDSLNVSVTGGILMWHLVNKIL